MKTEQEILDKIADQKMKLRKVRLKSESNLWKSFAISKFTARIRTLKWVLQINQDV